MAQVDVCVSKGLNQKVRSSAQPEQEAGTHEKTIPTHDFRLAAKVLQILSHALHLILQKITFHQRVLQPLLQFAHFWTHDTLQ